MSNAGFSQALMAAVIMIKWGQNRSRNVMSGRRSGRKREKLACERGYLVILKEKFHLGKRERERDDSFSQCSRWVGGWVGDHQGNWKMSYCWWGNTVLIRWDDNTVIIIYCGKSLKVTVLPYNY